MKISWDTEEGYLWMTVSFKTSERAALDRRLEMLKFTTIKHRAPCKTDIEEPIEVWAHKDKNTLLQTISNHAECRLVDSLNDPIFGPDYFNLAILRLKLPADRPTRFNLGPAFIPPSRIQEFTVVVSDSIRQILQEIHNKYVTVDFKVEV